ncbi:hypothetical protein [Paenibacillus sp. YYML68]|uniref:hypothetical protein n=1 Tax=Paenibacillus sp. YYML68 TaxID=2909250 RepID=UPI00248F748E|nr:hypothetical protein [Paenibacillus sp. YYML68]
MDMLYRKLIDEAETELSTLLHDNEQLKRRLQEMNQQGTDLSLVEKEISSIILMSHMDNTKKLFELIESLKKKEQEMELQLERKREQLHKLKRSLSQTIRTMKAQVANVEQGGIG